MKMVKIIKIIVCIKQVPNTDKVKFDWGKGMLKRVGVQNIMNPDDLHAIEFALDIKERYGAQITAITMGPPQAEAVLRQAYALGADHGVLISDPAFASSDSLVTAKILKKTIQYLDHFHLILTGFQSIDGNTSHISYQLAESLGVPHLTNIHKIDIRDTEVIADRLYGHEVQKVKGSLPLLIAVKKESNAVRYPNLAKIKECYSLPIQTITIDDLGGHPEDYGSLSSPTKTIEGEMVVHRRKKEIFQGTEEEKIEQLVQKLKKYQILKA